MSSINNENHHANINENDDDDSSENNGDDDDLMIRQPNQPATVNNLFGNADPYSDKKESIGAYTNYIQEEMSPSNSAF